MGKDKEKKKDKKDRKKDKENERRQAPPELIEKADLLSEERMLEIEENTRRNLYVSTDWSLPFYLAQAYRGFIAVAYEQAGRTSLLLPEMQFSYAVLKHEDLHVSRKALKRCGRYHLTIDQRIDEVLAGINKNHEPSWVTKEYETLLRVLIRRPVGVPVLGASSMLKVHSIELLDGDQLIAGELGYVVGAVYVSLTGFIDRNERAAPADCEAASDAAKRAKLKYDGAGTVQLVALGRLLRHCGFAFWDLGHPPQPKTETDEARMMYKADLGAKVLQRDAFLKLWKEARNQTPRTSLDVTVGPQGMSAKDIICGDALPQVGSPPQVSSGPSTT